ncbi:hypothetical protein F4861DRAFT_137364 [Xylaria intraflava]|nr:hypothetical protein F4861DRAFT_137364 [Xylaria intraflava]
MGGGIKSKFKFPVPGRSSKKQQVPTVSVSGPLSKAQRILGADGINIGSSRLMVNVDRSWETGSTGDISMSMSESNASQSTHDSYADQKNERRARWEEESAISPRNIHSAHGHGQKGLKMKRSALTVGDESRDGMPKAVTRDRRLSTSTIDSHYDSTKMPLAISQQTSNSAMAKGLPMRIGQPPTINGGFADVQMGKKKKKPTRLDLSRLRPKGHRDRKKDALDVEPGYMTRSTSFLPQTLESTMPLSLATEGRQASMPKMAAHQRPLRPSRSKGITDATGLDRLYNHYEQMSFQNEEALEESDDRGRDHTTTYLEHGTAIKSRPTSTFTHSLVAPSPPSRTTNWGHSRNNSHESKTTGSIADSSGGLNVQSAPRNDYAGSVSSRYTRTSKASPSCRSMVSDRQQQSVLSLSDSSDDEAIESSPSAPTSRRGSLTHGTVSENPNLGRGQQNPNHLHGATGPKKFVPSLHQLDEHLAVKSVSGRQANGPQSNNVLHSNHSSMSTLTPAHFLPHSARGSQSSRSAGTPDSGAMSFIPLASTIESPPNLSLSMSTQHLEKILLRKNSNATSRFSHSSEQPTPPISPNSVEFYVKSRESLQRDAMANGSTEANNARLMAVTRQEEMLLAALRQKRAKMREPTSSEAEEDRKSRTNLSSRSSFGSPKGASPTSKKATTAQSPIPEPDTNLKTTAWPLGETDQQNILRKRLLDVQVPSTTSRSDVTEGTSTSATGSTTSTTFDSRNDRILLYLDQPNEDTNTAASSLEFSDDYMDDSDGEDLVANERRTSRMQSRRDSAFSAARGHSSSSVGSRRASSSHSSQYRKDSIPFHTLNPPLKGYRLQDVPEVEPHLDIDKHVDTDLDDDLDGFPQPPMPPPSWPLPPPPGKVSTKPNSPDYASHSPSPRTVPPSHPPESKASQLKGKKSMVRLSAVGYMNSPMPWWGDDD